MFDIGWSELFLVIVVAVLVLGPEEIPRVMIALGRIMRRLNYMRFALSQQFETIMKDAGVDINELRMDVNFEAKKLDAPDFDEAAADEEEAGKNNE